MFDALVIAHGQVEYMQAQPGLATSHLYGINAFYEAFG